MFGVGPIYRFFHARQEDYYESKGTYNPERFYNFHDFWTGTLGIKVYDAVKRSEYGVGALVGLTDSALWLLGLASLGLLI